ncbi:Alpha/Beta hydrolase protein [Mycena epipterygia]|nr:Alpha/Beta hydrolase protein [Mycena epipterygia]
MFPKMGLTSLVLFATLAKAAPTVQFGRTTLTGSVSNNVEFYGGIPYAEPPVGGLRFKPTVLMHGLNTATFNATQFGLGCLQPGSPSSEDCLTINIFRPAGVAATAHLPALQFIPCRFSRRIMFQGTPVIFASFNYRLGPLGFPPGVEAAERNALNLGLKDQVTAMQWIQDNTAIFGGDKSKVTVFGESAGASSITLLYLNSNLKDLVRTAIFESPANVGIFEPSRSQSDWDNFVRAVPSCANSLRSGNSIPCLQSANATTLLQAIGTATDEAGADFPWGPTIDGPGGLLPDLPSVLLEKGKFARIPFIAGGNLDEGTFFTTPTISSTNMIRASLISNYTSPQVPSQKLSSAVDKLLELYPDVPALGSPFNTGNETFGLSSQYKRYAAMSGDLIVQSQRRSWSQAASKFGLKTFAYLFNGPAPPLVSPTFIGNITVPTTPLPLVVMTHTSEVFYVFGLEAALSTQMVDYWVSFATSLDPNDGRGSTRPVWGQYTCNDEAVLQLNGTNTTMIPDNYRAQQIDFIISNSAALSR